MSHETTNILYKTPQSHIKFFKSKFQQIKVYIYQGYKKSFNKLQYQYETVLPKEEYKAGNATLYHWNMEIYTTMNKYEVVTVTPAV